MPGYILIGKIRNSGYKIRNPYNPGRCFGNILIQSEEQSVISVGQSVIRLSLDPIQPAIFAIENNKN